MKITKSIITITLLIMNFSACSQPSMNVSELEKHTTYFNLESDYSIDEKGTKILNKLIGSAQFVGLAEVHQSQQLSLLLGHRLLKRGYHQ